MFNLRNIRSRINWHSPVHQVALFVSGSILVLSVLVTLAFVITLANQNANDYTAKLDQQKNAVGLHTVDMIESYNKLLLSTAAMQNVQGTLTREQWRNWFYDARIPSVYPNILGIGTVKKLNADDISAFEEKLHNEGYTDASVTPSSPRQTYTAIDLLEPNNLANRKAIGYDMFSENIRRQAMEKARDQDDVAISQPVNLVQDEGTKDEGTPGVLMYYPLYTAGMPVGTIEERRAAITGYVYLAIHPGDIIKSYFEKNTLSNDDTITTITDVTNNENHIILRHAQIEKHADRLDKFTKVVSRDFQVDNRTWRVDVAVEDFSVRTYFGPLALLIIGLTLSTLLGLWVLSTLLSRILAVETSMEEEIQRSKDELLALASHQLRTPASGVKQYIGMLEAGLLGELTDAQKSVAKKAYQANERQLEIINELLYVSKIDAGQLHIVSEHVDISEILRRTVDTFKQRAEEKTISLSLSGAKKSKFLYGDERYLAMIIDNLVSNAIKYSYPESAVKIKMTHGDDTVRIEVSDHGVGMTDDDITKIFGKFNRVANPLSQREGGSGLGLFLAKQLAVAHGGDIQVSSTPGKGSIFTLILPIHEGKGVKKVDIK